MIASRLLQKRFVGLGIAGLGPVAAAFAIGGFMGVPVGSALRHEKATTVQHEEWYVQSLERCLAMANQRNFELYQRLSQNTAHGKRALVNE